MHAISFHHVHLFKLFIIKIIKKYGEYTNALKKLYI